MVLEGIKSPRTFLNIPGERCFRKISLRTEQKMDWIGESHEAGRPTRLLQYLKNEMMRPRIVTMLEKRRGTSKRDLIKVELTFVSISLACSLARFKFL